jgi:hypothetical protein
MIAQRSILLCARIDCGAVERSKSGLPDGQFGALLAALNGRPIAAKRRIIEIMIRGL